MFFVLVFELYCSVGQWVSGCVLGILNLSVKNYKSFPYEEA